MQGLISDKKICFEGNVYLQTANKKNMSCIYCQCNKTHIDTKCHLCSRLYTPENPQRLTKCNCGSKMIGYGAHNECFTNEFGKK